MKRNVAIVGGGTAGLIAARKLGEYGIKATVYDQKKKLGYPARASGILSVSGLAGLGIDYRRAMTNTLYGANIHASGQVMKIISDRSKAHVLDRVKLNETCYDQAVASGAEVVLEKRIGGEMLDSLSRNNIVMGADGAISTVAKHFSMGEIKKVVLTYKAEYNTNPENSKIVELFFDKGISPGLFGWLCPNADDILEVGIGIESKCGNAKAAFDKFIKTKYVAETIGNGKMIDGGASIIPTSLREKIVDNRKKVLLVGDAAGQVKPSTGGGIIFGGNAALIASETIKEHLENGTNLEKYRELYNKKFRLDTSIHSFANKIYSGIGDKNLGRMIKTLSALKVDRFLGKYGEMDMPSLMLRNVFFKPATS